MLQELVLLTAPIGLLCLSYLKAPVIEPTVPDYKTNMPQGFYLMDKPIITDKAPYTTLLVNGQSTVEVECNHATLLPTTNKPRILYNGYNTECLNISVTLPQPVYLHTNRLRLKQLNPSRLTKPPLPGTDTVLLDTAEFSQALVDTSNSRQSTIYANGLKYLASSDQPTKGIYNNIVVKDNSITSMQRVRPLVPDYMCQQVTPYGLYDRRHCFEQTP